MYRSLYRVVVIVQPSEIICLSILSSWFPIPAIGHELELVVLGLRMRSDDGLRFGVLIGRVRIRIQWSGRALLSSSFVQTVECRRVRHDRGRKELCGRPGRTVHLRGGVVPILG